MSKKILIIKPRVMISDKEWSKVRKDISESLYDWGILLLANPALDYEFGEIDGVKWEKEESQDKKPGVDYDYIIKMINNMTLFGHANDEGSIKYLEGAKDALNRVLRLLEELRDKEKESEANC